jgi:transcriptional regulator with XRE-family HTH domain
MRLPLHVAATQPTLGDYIRIRNIDTADLAKQLDVAHRYVVKWCEGTATPRKATAVKLAKILDVDFADLLDMMAAGFDARQENEQKRIVRLISACLHLLGSLPVVPKTLAPLRELSETALQLGNRKFIFKLRKQSA